MPPHLLAHLGETVSDLPLATWSTGYGPETGSLPVSSVIVKGLEQPQLRLPILCTWACDLFLFICCWFQLFAVRFIFLFFANIRPNLESHNSGCLSIAYFKSPQTTRLTVTGGGKKGSLYDHTRPNFVSFIISTSYASRIVSGPLFLAACRWRFIHFYYTFWNHYAGN